MGDIASEKLESKSLKEPNIKVRAIIEKGVPYEYDRVCLILESYEQTRLICSAILTQANLLVPFSKNTIDRQPIKIEDKLAWISPTDIEKQNCEAFVEAQDKTRKISIAKYNNGIFITYCRNYPDDFRYNHNHGIIEIEVTVSGRIPSENNRSINPIKFNGYIYALMFLELKLLCVQN